MLMLNKRFSNLNIHLKWIFIVGDFDGILEDFFSQCHLRH